MTRDASRPLRHTQSRHAGAPAWLVITGALQLLVALASPVVEAAVSELNCSLAAQAQDVAVTLTWQLLEGDGNFTRISHSSEALPAASAAASDRLLVLGGIEYESAQPVVASPVLVFNVASNSFFSPQDQILSSVSTAYQATSVDAVFVSPASRVEHASFVHRDGSAFLFGGQSREFLNDTWRGCLDGSSTNMVWDQLVTATDATTTAARPVPRVGHSFTKVFENSSVIGALVFGGLSEDYVELGDLRLALIAKTSASSARACSDRGPKLVWRVLQTTPLTDSGPVPQARAYHCTMTTSKLFTASKLACLVVYGGKSVQDNVIFDELWRLCPSTSSSSLSLPVERQSHTWELLSEIGTTPGARYGASMTFVDEGKVALAGGSYTFPNDFLNDVWELNVNATQWVRLSFTTDFSPPRRGHTLSFFSTSKRLFLFGGRDRYSVVQKRMEATDYDAPFCTIGFTITFCSATATYVCIPCPSGSYLESGTRNCLSCPQGTFSSEGAAECTKCPAGTFSSAVGKNSSDPCTSCPIGTFSQSTGAGSSATCVACAGGTFAASKGTVSCSNCAAGSFSNANASTCTLCQAGQWSSARAASCLGCAAGTYTPSTGSIACYACPRGFFSDAGDVACSPCPSNTSSVAISAAASDCLACPLYAFTASGGQTECEFCPVGSSLVEGRCQSCSAGFYSSNATEGVCAPCPKETYASDPGSQECQRCPSGEFTASVGSTSSSDCRLCASGSFFNGATCQACGAGTYPEPSGFCSACTPGSFFAGGNDGAAVLSLGCSSCRSMSYSSDRGATACSACPDDAFSMLAWRNCISCSASTSTPLSGCILGRNGLLCSGNGDCNYGGCACGLGWVGGDCSAPVSGAMNSSASPTPAVLYFPASPLQVVNASVSSTTAAIEIQIARAGDLTSRLQATVAWGSRNLSSSSSLLPATLDFAPGEEQKSISLPMAQLSPRRGCRFFSLALEDLPGANPSVVSSDSDSEIFVYLDDLNGVSGGNAGRSVTSVYTRQEAGKALAVVALDRLVPTQVTLTSSSTVKDANLGAALRDQPLNLLVVIDPSVSVAATVVAQLPAIVAKLQSVYLTPSRGVRMGLMSGSSNGSAVFYHDLADFFDAARAFVGLNSSVLEGAPLTWQWVADGLLGSSDAASWPSRDRRHLLVVGAEGLTANANTSTPSRLTDVLRGQNVFAFALSRTQTVFSDANDVMKGIQYGNATAAIPSLICQAFQQRDAEMPPQVNVLADPVGLVASAQVWGFSAGPSSLPIIGVKLGSFPTPAQLKTVTSTAVVVGVPGIIQLSINVQEPGPACFPLMSPPPIDLLPLSGWADAWHLSTISEISRLWKSFAAPSTLEMALFPDASLLRTSTSAILSISDSNSMNLSLTRTFPGSYFAAGLSLVTRGYWRSAPSNAGAESATCSIQTHLTGVNASLKATNTVSFPPHVVPGEWTYGFLQSIIPWELSNLTVTLVCNTSSPGVSVEWAALGLLPDPAFACTCPRGFYHDALAGASLSDGTCVRCAAGSYCAAGIKRQCPDGTFSFGKAASCESCRDGWICTDGLARLCEPGTYSTPSFTCGVCPSGYACRNGKKTMCPAGTFSLEQASDCQSCPPGTISRSDGSSTCELCPLGWTSNYQRNHCVSCPAGEATLHVGQHPCSSCVATSFPVRADPELCLA